jgi:hypothetical protein
MKAISLWQPYASLIAVGVKSHETRSWAPPASAIGQRIAIHAAKRRPHAIELSHLRMATERYVIDGGAAKALDIVEAAWDDKLPLGAIVCTGILSAAYQCGVPGDDGQVQVIRSIARGDSPVLIQSDPFGDFSPGRWAWLLEDVEPLAVPAPTVGRQGWWTWEPNFPPPPMRHVPAPGGFPANAQE